MPKHTFDIQSDENYDFDVFSITSVESVYVVIHEINKLLNLEIALSDLLDYRHEKGEDFYFPLYSYWHEPLNIDFYLLPNNTSYQGNKTKTVNNTDLFSGDIEQNVKLIPELENTDYFLIIKGDNRLQYNHTVFETLKKSAAFITMQEIFLSELKDKKAKGNLLF
jgi:hypothetical protein